MYDISGAAKNSYCNAVIISHTEEFQDEACKDSYWAYRYARDIKGADIGYCQEAACKDPYWAYCFARNVVGVDLEACLKGVRESFWEDEVRNLVVEKVIG